MRSGKSDVANPFIVRSDKYWTEVIDGNLTITVKIAKKYGKDIVLTTTTSGKNVDLTGTNLRIIVKNGFTEIHYATEKGEGRACGAQVLGIDKGYTEAFTDADHNAALNVLARSPAQLSVKRLELGAQARQPSADKSYAQLCATF